MLNIAQTVSALATAIALLSPPASAADARVLRTHTVNFQWHHDFRIILSRPEVDTLGADETKAAILAALSGSIPPPYGEIVAIWVISHINDIQKRTGDSGASIEFTVVTPVGLWSQIIGYRNWKVGGCENPCSF
jgi:hypothetical protein